MKVTLEFELEAVVKHNGVTPEAKRAIEGVLTAQAIDFVLNLQKLASSQYAEVDGSIVRMPVKGFLKNCTGIPGFKVTSK